MPEPVEAVAPVIIDDHRREAVERAITLPGKRGGCCARTSAATDAATDAATGAGRARRSRNICRGCRRAQARQGFCSPACRRWDQDRRRKIDRREEALEGWRQEARHGTRHALEDVQREMAELEAEVWVLRHQTRPAAPPQSDS